MKLGEEYNKRGKFSKHEVICLPSALIVHTLIRLYPVCSITKLLTTHKFLWRQGSVERGSNTEIMETNCLMQINLGKDVDNRAFHVHLRHSSGGRSDDEKIESHDDHLEATKTITIMQFKVNDSMQR